MRRKIKNPSKQRKKERNASLHQRQKEMTIPLKPSLKEKFETRRTQVREGDKVKVQRGDHKGKTGEVKKVNLKEYKVEIEDIERETQDQERVNIKFHPSNLMITKLDLEDPKREQKIKKGKNIETKDKEDKDDKEQQE